MRLKLDLVAQAICELQRIIEQALIDRNQRGGKHGGVAARQGVFVMRGGLRFPRQVIALLTEAIHERKRCVNGEIALERFMSRRDKFDERLWEILWRARQVPEQATFAKHLQKHAGEIFAFVTDPFLEATNWQAEQAIRPAVVNRKVWGGNRTPVGARAQSVLMSVLETCRRQARSALDYVSQTLRRVGNLLLPQPILLPTR